MRLPFLTAHRAKPEQLTRRVIFWTMTGGENPAPGRPGNARARCLVGAVVVLGTKEGSTDTSPSLFGVETVVWSTVVKHDGNLKE